MPLAADVRETLLNDTQLNEIDFVYPADGSHLSNFYRDRFKAHEACAGTADGRLITRYAFDKFGGYGPFWYAHHATFLYDHNRTISRISHPTLILTNTGDPIYESAKQTKAMRPDFEMVELQGGTHDIVDQQPDAWADAVASFLTS